MSATERVPAIGPHPHSAHAPSEADDPRVVRALEEYVAATQSGEKPNRKEFQARYPEIAAALGDCLEGLDFVDAAAPQLAHPAAGQATHKGCGPFWPAETLGDYRIVREIGRGGMGVVYEVIQVSLGRRVALKVLPFAAALDAKQLQRFKNEAQAAAQLHHQHIVPVYGVGCERGVHYYAMQFIDGQTLAALIGELRLLSGLGRGDAIPATVVTVSSAAELLAGHWAPAAKGEARNAARFGLENGLPRTSKAEGHLPRPFPPQVHGTAWEGHSPGTCSTKASLQPTVVALTDNSTKSPAFFRTVANLVMQAAMALEHAHAMGVVHRDVKPGNLLIDSRGNLWVTDFGLAHCQSQAGLTMTGDLMGTLRYMSPEQSLGQRVLLDHRTDIYSLGATLYELLTLEPVFDRRDRHELLRQIAHDEPRRPRSLNKTVPVELETIALKALEKNPADRYATAQLMADDLQRYLKDEPIRARPPTLAHKIKKWVCRHRGIVWTAAVGVLVTLSSITGVIGWAVRDRLARDEEVAEERATRETALDAEVQRALDESAPLMEQGRWQAALAAVERADKLLSAAGRTARPARLRELERELRIALRLEETYLEPHLRQNQTLTPESAEPGDADLIVEWQAADVEFFRGRNQDIGFADLFREMGIDVETLGTTEAAKRVRGTNVRLALLRALDEWAMVRRRARGVESPGWKKLVEIAAAADDNTWRQQFRGALLKRDRQALEELAGTAPLGELAPATAYLLAMFLRELQSLDKALVVLRTAQRHHPDDFWINHELGWLYARAVRPPRHDEALRYHSAALAIWPQHVGTHIALAELLTQRGAVDEASAEFSTAVHLAPSSASVWIDRGMFYHRQHEYEKACADFSKVIELEPNLVWGWADRSSARVRLGRYTEALADANKAAEIDPFRYRHLTDEFIALGRVRDGLALYNQAIERQPNECGTWWRRGELYCRLGLPDLAATDFTKAFQIQIPSSPRLWFWHALLRASVGDVEGYGSVAVELPRHFKPSPTYRSGHNELARALTLAPVAGADLGWAAEIAQLAVIKEPGAWSHNALGAAHYRDGKYEQALGPLREALSLDTHWRFAIVSHSLLAMAYHHLNRADEARRAFIDAEQKLDEWHQSLSGLPLEPLGSTWWDVLEGLVFYREAKLLLDGSAPRCDPRPMVVRANALAAVGDRGEAEEACRCALQLAVNDPAVCLTCARIHAGLGRYDLALADYSNAIELDPESADRANDFAWFLATCAEPEFRDPRRAVELAKKVVELVPKEAHYWNTLGAAYYRAGDWRSAVGALDKSCDLRNGGDVFDWYLLAMAHWQLADKEESRRWYSKAVEWTDKNQSNNEELLLFRAEANGLLDEE